MKCAVSVELSSCPWAPRRMVNGLWSKVVLHLTKPDPAVLGLRAGDHSLKQGSRSRLVTHTEPDPAALGPRAGDHSLTQGLKGDATYLVVNDKGALENYGINGALRCAARLLREGGLRCALGCHMQLLVLAVQERVGICAARSARNTLCLGCIGLCFKDKLSLKSLEWYITTAA